MFRFFALLFVSQIAAQIAQLLTGLLIVRSLTIPDYAVYTLFSLTVSLMALLSDPGLSQILVSMCAKISTDRARVERLAHAVFKRSLTLMLIGSIPIAFYIWSVLSTFKLSTRDLVFFCTTLALQAYLSQAERIAVAKRNIYGDISGYARTGFYSSNARLIFIVAMTATAMAMPWEYAVWSMPIGSLVTLALLAARSRNSRVSLIDISHDASVRSDMRHITKLLLPLLIGTAYHILQAQLPMMLAAGSADANAIGEFGALSRIGQIVGIVGVLNSNLLTSHLVGRMHIPRAFVRRVVEVTVLYSLYLLCIAAITLAFPTLWFSIIGQQYEHLASLLLPVILLSGAGLIGTVFYLATISLEQTRLQWLHFLGGAIAIMAFTLIRGLPLRTSADIIWLSFSLMLAFMLVQLIILLFSIRWSRQ